MTPTPPKPTREAEPLTDAELATIREAVDEGMAGITLNKVEFEISAFTRSGLGVRHLLATIASRDTALKTWKDGFNKLELEIIGLNEQIGERDATIAAAVDVLDFYADPWEWCKAHSEDEPGVDFYGECEMGERAQAVLDSIATETITRLARQRRVKQFVDEAFGPDSVEQRALRFLEEAIEAFQAASGNQEQGLRLFDYVFNRPVGELSQELGGVGITLLALAETAGLDADAEEQRELRRVLSKPIEHFRARNQAKNDAGFRASALLEARKGMRTAGAMEVCPRWSAFPHECMWFKAKGAECNFNSCPIRQPHAVTPTGAPSGGGES